MACIWFRPFSYGCGPRVLVVAVLESVPKAWVSPLPYARRAEQRQTHLVCCFSLTLLSAWPSCACFATSA